MTTPIAEQAAQGEVANTSPVQEFIEQNYDLISAVEESWDTVNETVRAFLSDEFTNSVLDRRLEEISPDLAQQDVKPKELRKMASEMRERIRSTIQHGHAAAGIIMWSHGDSASKQERDRSRDLHRVGYYQIAADAVPEDAMPNGSQALIAEATCTVADVFTNAYTAEERLLEPLYEILSQDAMLVEDLIDYLEENSQYGNCDGLLAALARAHFDPASISVINECLNAVANTPDAYTPRYVRELTAHSEATDTLVEQNAGIELVNILAQFATKHALPKNSVAEFLQNDLPFDNYPSVLKADVVDSIDQFKASVRKRFEAILQPFNLPRRFVIKLRNRPTGPKTGTGSKQRRVVSSRATPADSRNQPVFNPEQDVPQKVINRIYIGKKNGGKGSVYNKMHIASSEIEDQNDEEQKTKARSALVDELMETREVKDYLRVYSNEADMRTMLGDLIKNPRGQAVSTMQGILIKISFGQHEKPSVNRSFSVQRYSPSDTTINDTFSDKETTRTRIAFCTFKDESGVESLMIVKIGHKTEFEKLTGTMKSDRI